MFGYVRPLKPELLVREYERYRSVYCGICRQIRHDYGQLPRLAVSYDLTLLALLLLSLEQDPRPGRRHVCLINPVVRRHMADSSPVLEHCAALSVLLAWHKADDLARDGRPIRGSLAKLPFTRAHKRAGKRYPDYADIIRRQMSLLQEAEQRPPDPAAAGIFGTLLQQLVAAAAREIDVNEPVRQALGLIGHDLGSWIYLIDAIDDWQDDCNNKNWNPFGQCRSLADAQSQAEPLLAEREASLDRTAALLPYRRDSGLMANIFTSGLPAVRKQVFSGMFSDRL